MYITIDYFMGGTWQNNFQIKWKRARVNNNNNKSFKTSIIFIDMSHRESSRDLLQVYEFTEWIIKYLKMKNDYKIKIT